MEAIVMVVLKKLKSVSVIALLVALAIFILGLKAEKASGIHRPADSPPKEASEKNTGTVPATQEQRKIKYWAAPMDPTYIRNKPGKSPMGMDLVPVYEDGSGQSDDGTVSIDPVTVQSMGVRTTKVTRSPLITSIRTIGHITYDEERVTHIHTKVSGWVEQLFVKTTGEKIVKNQKILSIYSPELVATEQEYLQALSYKDKVSGSSFPDIVSGADTLLESTKKRLLLMDISPEQIKAIEDSGHVQTTMVLRSPATGIVIKKQVFEGMKVNPGMDMYTIADVSRVWVIASIYEYELPFINVGQETEMTLPYEPGTSYRGTVTFIYPYLSPKTRTVQVRMEFDNPDLKLKPDMYADVVITTKISKDVLQVPSEAILRTGYRNIVITSLGNGKFLPKTVEMGPEGEGMTQILSGLAEGETIVTSGQFLIDSESNLKEAIHKMLQTLLLKSRAKQFLSRRMNRKV
jgi:multidrug efflux pump subunit AcrA (membrane-fusion protein)